MHVSPPTRVRRTYRQHLVAPPEEVFPLLCPVRERDWVQGWNPALVFSESGVAERDCVFVTPDRSHDAVWVVTEHDPEQFFLELVKVSPGFTVGRISIRLEPDGDGTAALVSYMHTALSDAGRAFVEQFTEEFYEAFMKEWEESMNHYLVTGTMRTVEE